MTDETLRIGDRDRDITAQALAEHYAAGRLTRDELDHRTNVVLRARTRLDLREVLADLPALDGPGARARESVLGIPPGPAARMAGLAGMGRIAVPQDAAVAHRARRLWRSVGLAPWAVFGVFFVVLWALTGAGYFWPVWPILGWGLGVATTGVLAYTLPEVYLERQRARRQHGRPCLAGRPGGNW